MLRVFIGHVASGLLVCVLLLIGGCVFLVPNTPGCTDGDALNYDSSAVMDDSSCRYSRVVFYASADRYEYIPDPGANQFFIVPIDTIVVTIDGSTLGKTRIFHPSGPGGCGAAGTLGYEFTSGNTIGWRAIVLLVNGKRVFTSGTLRPRSEAPCIAVDVTSN